jgi:acyl dehydratase
LRFSRPVPVGAKVRAVADLAAAASRPRGFTEATIAVSVEIKGEQHPAYTARQNLLFHRAAPVQGAGDDGLGGRYTFPE